MQVNLSFDTEKDSVEEFVKLKDYIEKIIAEKKEQHVPSKEVKPANHPPKRTGGGCRVVPYQDLSNELFSLCSKKK
ncbi:MAG: hypothetical protein V1914_03340 [archaeon]